MYVERNLTRSDYFCMYFLWFLTICILIYYVHMILQMPDDKAYLRSSHDDGL